MPLISVCIAAEPYAKYLPEVVSSVLKQSFADFELLICCSEGSKAHEFAGAACKQDSRVRRIELAGGNPEQDSFVPGTAQGTYAARDRQLNCALLESRGSLVQFLGHTDSLEPGCLQAFAQSFAMCESVTLVVAGYRLVSASGSTIETSAFEDANSAVSGREVTRQSLLTMKPAFEQLSPACFRRHFALTGLDARYFLLSHYQFLAQIAAQGDCLFLAEPLCNVRQFAQQTQANQIKESLLWLHDYVLLQDSFQQFLKTENQSLKDEDWDAKNIATLHILQSMQERYHQRITPAEVMAAAREIKGVSSDYVLDCYIRLACQLSDSLYLMGERRNEAVEEARAKAQRAYKRGREEMRQELAPEIERQISSERQRLQDQIKALHEELAQLKHDHSRVLRSSSWRLTAPIRRLRAGMFYSRSLKR